MNIIRQEGVIGPPKICKYLKWVFEYLWIFIQIFWNIPQKKFFSKKIVQIFINNIGKKVKTCDILKYGIPYFTIFSNILRVSIFLLEQYWKLRFPIFTNILPILQLFLQIFGKTFSDVCFQLLLNICKYSSILLTDIGKTLFSNIYQYLFQYLTMCRSISPFFFHIQKILQKKFLKFEHV